MMDNLFNNYSAYLTDGSLLAYPLVYLGGLLVSFSPCVYPVAPITIAFIGANSGGSRGRGFRLSLLYVLGLAATYTVLGGVAALSGRLFGELQVSPWTSLFLANVCIIMGISLLGVFALPLQTPGFIGRALTRIKTKGYLGSFVVGAISGLVVGPCTAPVMAVLLSYVATRQNVFFGMSLFFFFSLGMGTLLMLLGTFAGLLTSLPKSGPWMERINRLSGCILLAMGEYLLINAGKLWT